jgi:sugar O-acyltransferase (sialic acid O-acetyltransferase NeuD family)
MNRLLIIGAGGLGREVLDWALHTQESRREWIVGGFLDANSSALVGKGVAVNVIGDPMTFDYCQSDRAVIAIGEPCARRRIATQLVARGVRFASVIHPTVLTGTNSRIGEGCILCPRVVISTNATIGAHVIINCASIVAHDTVVEDYCTISAAADITGNARVESGALLGSHACITPGSVVGKQAMVGAGSVVVGRVAPNSTVMGVPARTILRNERG